MERRPRPGSALHALDSVCTDHWYGAHLAVAHLTALGHRRIVFATRDDSPTARALRAALTEIAAARPELDAWALTLSSPDAGPDHMTGADRPAVDLPGVLRELGATACVLHGDVDALMLVQDLATHGVRVPEDCSVVAYDDVVAALGSTPSPPCPRPRARSAGPPPNCSCTGCGTPAAAGQGRRGGSSCCRS